MMMMMMEPATVPRAWRVSTLERAKQEGKPRLAAEELQVQIAWRQEEPQKRESRQALLP